MYCKKSVVTVVSHSTYSFNRWAIAEASVGLSKRPTNAVGIVVYGTAYLISIFVIFSGLAAVLETS